MKKLLALVLSALVLVGCAAKPAEFDKTAVFNDALKNHQNHQKMDVAVTLDVEMEGLPLGDSMTFTGSYQGNKILKSVDDLEFIAKFTAGSHGVSMGVNLYGHDGVLYEDGDQVEPSRFVIGERSQELVPTMNTILNLTDINKLQLTTDAIAGMEAKRTATGYQYTVNDSTKETVAGLNTVFASYLEEMELSIEDISFVMDINETADFQTLTASIALKGGPDNLPIQLKLSVKYNGFDDAVKLDFPNFSRFKIQ
ncbi:hypothetical protein G7062_09940 [Erysipelothrix sp. HDW6C]|uniref:hypothetical protein n=1 Tax=Erysipelothrix sp. HDW6C TaxID=2714930 RepID=UPI00140B9927|nr:hypothetical protein [Erysipelothrix sp. HDW6C]QIK70603.1 hypothetical protein G7062_09940 [Erysipelothrix sp. HDW6C]